MQNNRFTFEYESYTNQNELTESDRNLVKQAVAAAQNAYAPYSEFNVGAAVLLENEQIIKGNNQENAAYPSGLCAERVALFYANAMYPDLAVKAIAVVAIKNGDMVPSVVTPCGNCRQVMLETESRFKEPIRIVMGSKNGFWIVNKAQNLLPLSFTDDSL